MAYAPVLTRPLPLATPKWWTRDEYRQIPEGPPFYELEYGKLIEMARPKKQHQRMLFKLSGLFSNYLDRHPIGEMYPEVEVDLLPDTTYVPDLVYLKNEHLDRFENDQSIDGSVDLAIEILSRSTRLRDTTTKMEVYWSADVEEYWIIDPNTLGMQVFRHDPDGYRARGIPFGKSYSSELFPGLEINLAELMGELPSEDSKQDE